MSVDRWNAFVDWLGILACIGLVAAVLYVLFP